MDLYPKKKKFVRSFSINRDISKELDLIYLKITEKGIFFIRDKIGEIENLSNLVEMFIYSGIKHIKKILSENGN